MSGLISAAAQRLRAALAAATGGGLVGYSSGETYAAGTIGAGLKAEEAARASLAGTVDSNATAASNATATVANNLATLDAEVDTISAALTALIRPGFSIQHCGPLSADPAGWFIEDGRQLNVADEPALFEAIGYTWGGSGPVFNLPDTRDDFTRGASATRPVGTRESDQVGQHKHESGMFASDGTQGGSPIVVLTEPGGLHSVNGDTEFFGGSETRPRCVAKVNLIKR